MADLLALALLAIDDPDARVVLADACLEGGPSWEVNLEWPSPVVAMDGRHMGRTRGRAFVTIDELHVQWGFDDVGPGNDHEMRALAAALLFGGWEGQRFGYPPWPWPVVRRSLARFGDGSDATRRFRITMYVRTGELVFAPEDLASQRWLEDAMRTSYAELTAIGRDIAGATKVSVEEPPRGYAAAAVARLSEMFPEERFEINAALSNYDGGPG